MSMTHALIPHYFLVTDRKETWVHMKCGCRAIICFSEQCCIVLEHYLRLKPPSALKLYDCGLTVYPARPASIQLFISLML